jgi:hypothetical protein
MSNRLIPPPNQALLGGTVVEVLGSPRMKESDFRDRVVDVIEEQLGESSSADDSCLPMAGKSMEHHGTIGSFSAQVLQVHLDHAGACGC